MCFRSKTNKVGTAFQRNVATHLSEFVYPQTLATSDRLADPYKCITGQLLRLYNSVTEVKLMERWKKLFHDYSHLAKVQMPPKLTTSFLFATKQTTASLSSILHHLLLSFNVKLALNL